jgi:hypothetical protein
MIYQRAGGPGIIYKEKIIPDLYPAEFYGGGAIPVSGMVPSDPVAGYAFFGFHKGNDKLEDAQQ